MRQKARVEEGLKLSRERAAEKKRLEVLALDKKNKEKAELEEKKEVIDSIIGYTSPRLRRFRYARAEPGPAAFRPPVGSRGYQQ